MCAFVLTFVMTLTNGTQRGYQKDFELLVDASTYLEQLEENFEISNAHITEHQPFFCGQGPLED